MTTGPFLYDDEPAPLHTGTPRRRQGLLIALVVGTTLVAVGMVLAMFVVRGSPEEQAQEVVGVFLAALGQDDTETAYQLLCEEERARIAPDDVAAEYLGEGAGTVRDAEATGDEGALHVRVEWAGGGASHVVVIGESGPRVCGTASG